MIIFEYVKVVENGKIGRARMHTHKCMIMVTMDKKTEQKNTEENRKKKRIKQLMHLEQWEKRMENDNIKVNMIQKR